MTSAMNYQLLTKLECPCGSCHFHMENTVAATVHPRADITTVLCDEWCAFKKCLIAGGRVTPTDCQVCRSLDVAEGQAVCECGQTWQVRHGLPEFGDRAVTGQPANGLKVVETDFEKDPRWNRFVNAHPDGTVFHHSLWLRALKAEFSQQTLSLACVDESGSFQGILPLFYTRGLPLRIGQIGRQATGRRLASLPRTPFAGPLSIKPESTVALLAEAERRVRQENGIQLQIKVQRPIPGGLSGGLARTDWRSTYILRLPAPDQPFRINSSHQRAGIKWALNKAARSGVQVRPASSVADLRRWYSLYLRTMRRNAVPPRPYRFFLSLWELLKSRGFIQLLIAEVCGAGCCRMIAGSIFLKSGRTVCYVFTGSDADYLNMRPNEAILWRAINDACEARLQDFDFGEVPEGDDDLAKFKSKWGAEPVRLYRYYYPSVPRHVEGVTGSVDYFRLLQDLWRRVPLGATGLIGDRLYRYL